MRIDELFWRQAPRLHRGCSSQAPVRPVPHQTPMPMAGSGDPCQVHCRDPDTEKKMIEQGQEGILQQERMKDSASYWVRVMIWMGGIYWGSSLSILPGPLSSPRGKVSRLAKAHTLWSTPCSLFCYDVPC